MKSICFTIALVSSIHFSGVSQGFLAPQKNPFSLTQHGNRSSPAFADIDMDGDFDLFTGLNSGDFGFFENIGSFGVNSYGPFITPFFNISAIGGNATPFFVDLDNDGDLDLMSGGDGGLRYYENVGTPQFASFGNEIQSPFLIVSPAGISKPYMVDIDNDDDMDLFVGAIDGNIYYYQNTGSKWAPEFASAITNSFNLMNIGARAAPSFADLDGDGDLDALIGNQQGEFYYFQNIGSEDSPSFSAPLLNPYGLQNIGDDAKPYFADLTNDGKPDLLVGNTFGDYHYFENDFNLNTDELNLTETTIFPNPSNGQITIRFNGVIDQTLELSVTDMFGRPINAEFNIEKQEATLEGILAPGLYFIYTSSETDRIQLGRVMVK